MVELKGEDKEKAKQDRDTEKGKKDGTKLYYILQRIDREDTKPREPVAFRFVGIQRSSSPSGAIQKKLGFQGKEDSNGKFYVVPEDEFVKFRKTSVEEEEARAEGEVRTGDVVGELIPESMDVV